MTSSSNKSRSIESSCRCSCVTVRVVADGDRFFVVLDNKPLRTPGGILLTITSRPLADAIASEWMAQSEKISLATLPLTQLANIATDWIPISRQCVLNKLIAFATTDLVCYRATIPRVLVERQQAQWQPLLDWVARYYGVLLKVTHGVMPVTQPPEMLINLRAALARMHSLHLVALYKATALCGSLVVALALVNGKIDANAAFVASQLDVLFQAERWGVDFIATALHESMLAELGVISHFVTLL